MTSRRDTFMIFGHGHFTTLAEEISRMHMAIEHRHWTVDEKDALPEDGNRYEVIHGDLLVTPTPTDAHETVAARLTRIVDRYVEAEGLGFTYHPRAVIRLGDDVEVEPDLMVRREHDQAQGSWSSAPLPILVVEIASLGTRAIDLGRKRALYIDEAGIPEYWIVDGDTRTVRSCAPGRDDIVCDDRLTWHPAGATAALVVPVAAIFGDHPRGAHRPGDHP
jgi:Uma2 family endonuclease